jgi:hypothetical protein
MNAQRANEKKRKESGQVRLSHVWVYPAIEESVKSYIKNMNLIESRFRKSRGEPVFEDGRFKK